MRNTRDQLRRFTLPLWTFVLLMLSPCAWPQAPMPVPSTSDPHYTAAGFFDIHLCNWPGQPPFFMALFSSERFGEIQSVDVLLPDGTPLGQLDLQRFRVVHRPGKPEKRVFIRHFALPDQPTDGWYRASIQLANGERLVAADFVVIQAMARAWGLVPAPGATVRSPPAELQWEPVPGATHYQVYLKDLWAEHAEVNESGVLTEPRWVLPSGVVQPGGLYAWRIHARDVNGNVLLGDFNHGSLSEEVQFAVEDR